MPAASPIARCTFPKFFVAFWRTCCRLAAAGAAADPMTMSAMMVMLMMMMTTQVLAPAHAPIPMRQRL
jgi:hypothetical protein